MPFVSIMNTFQARSCVIDDGSVFVDSILAMVFLSPRNLLLWMWDFITESIIAPPMDWMVIGLKYSVPLKAHVIYIHHLLNTGY
jgi:hypothetical protein